MLAGIASASADDGYKTSQEYLALRDSMRHAFNSGDSARFFPALSRLEDYLLKQKDLHAYYTQRCNEIVFQMNRQRIFEAYKLARQLSKELRERKLDNEMYMAYNMLGHLNRYCGNKAAAKQCFYKVIELMEKGGYYESMPPIYMNLVNVELDDDPKEAQRLLDKAAEIAAKYSPDRVFDIETRKTLSYYNGGDTERFLEGYKRYREGVAQGQSSVHGRSIDIYYQACMGNTDEAVAMARKELADDAHATITKIFERSGRWKEAYESLREETSANDSVNNVILSNSIQIFRDELHLYDIEREAAQTRLYTLATITALLLLLLMACGYILFSHRRHMRQIKRAYEHALESDKMKAAFIQNMSHEVRTPLNVISGFAQVLANPELSSDGSKRKEMAKTMLANTRIITNQIDEMLELSFNESSGAAPRVDVVVVNTLLSDLVRENRDYVSANVSLSYSSPLPDNFSIKTQHGMLRRALNTLIDNAIKNTSRGTIILKADTAGTEMTIAVEDTGTGIPMQDAERVFERFVKLDSFKAGLGLGLTLCRKIITRLGGTVSVDTSYRGGARLVITLPIDK
jgi:signal transduction histidine kinase